MGMIGARRQGLVSNIDQIAPPNFWSAIVGIRLRDSQSILHATNVCLYIIVRATVSQVAYWAGYVEKS
jgi:hypothetical protein